MPAGRPREYDYEEIARKLNEYTDDTNIPSLAEFAYLNDIDRTYLYQMADMDEEISHAIKKCMAKKEFQLEKLGRIKAIDPGFAIFSLKQLGWSDKQHLEMTGRDGGPVEISRTSDLSEEEKEELIKAAAELIQKK